LTGGQPEDPRLVVLDSEVPAPDYTEGKHEDMENFTFALLGQYLKVLNNEKKGGLEVVAFDRSPFKPFHAEIFKQIGTDPHPLRGFSEPCFCHLKSIIVCK
jgi:hypothetical protein